MFGAKSQIPGGKMPVLPTRCRRPLRWNMGWKVHGSSFKRFGRSWRRQPSSEVQTTTGVAWQKCWPKPTISYGQHNWSGNHFV